MRFWHLALLAPLCWSAPATPAPPKVPSVATGNDLLETCDKDAPTFVWWLCTGFIDGVDGTVGIYAVNKVIAWPYCYPTGVTKQQMRDVVSSYLSAHPERRHLPGQFLVIEALSAAFPCK